MSISMADVSELFNILESNRVEDVKEVVKKFVEMFNNIKDGWLVNGFIDYFHSTGSLRAVDILIKVPMPHDKFVFDRLSEGLRGNRKCDSLNLLGHVVRRQPLWLYRITNSPLFRDLLNLLKHEDEIVPLMSGLLILITLLPMIPLLVREFFQDIFDVFGRLADYGNRIGTEHLEGYREHLQMGLYGLFHNLYGMYPCNFMDYLRREYSKKENSEVFIHTVKPMLETVKVHPFLITASKSSETDITRWKKMEHHDVLIECRRFSSEGTYKQVRDMDETQFRARCGTDVSSLTSTHAVQSIASTSTSTPNLSDGSVMGIGAKYENAGPGVEGWFSLWEACGGSSLPSAPNTPLPLPLSLQETPISHPHSYTPLSVKQDNGSPPEPAIEATPENTPIKDTRQRFNFSTNSPVVRTLDMRQPPRPLQHHQVASSYSQPPSPLKKEPSPFSRMSSVEGGAVIDGQDKKDSFYTQSKISKILHDRSQQTSDTSSISSPHKHIPASPLKKISIKDPSCFIGVPSVPNSPVPLGTAAPTSGSTDWPLAKPKPHKDGVPFDIATGRENITNLNILPNVVENMKDDKEIIELSKRGEVMRSTSITRDAHLVFAETEIKHRGGSRLQQEDKDDEGDEHWADGDTICEVDDKFCSDKKHGLHMPNSSSILDIARRITKTRSRYYSHCVAESSQTVIRHDTSDSDIETQKSKSVRKVKSCPDLTQIFKKMELKSKDCYDKDLLQIQSSVVFENGNMTSVKRKTVYCDTETQTVSVWPNAYDNLLNDYVQKICEQTKPDDTTNNMEEKVPPVPFSPYSQVDRYIEILSQKSFTHVMSPSQRSPKEEIEYLRQQLQLLQLELMYERFRREVHAVRNRRLLGRSRKNRAAEEQNITLKQQITAQQLEIEELRQQLIKQNKNLQLIKQEHTENKMYWQHQINLLERDVVSEKKEKEKLAAQFLELQNVSIETSADVQHLHSALFEVSQQLVKANKKSDMCDYLLECIKRLQRELVMFGERDARFGSFTNAPTKADALITKINQQYKDQIMNAQAMLQAQTSKLEYLQAREADLEAILLSKDHAAQEFKKQLRLVKEEHNERVKVIEEKYQTVKRINQRMESHCLELLQRIPQSPQTISRELTSGFSPQSSPLSASLASSDGHPPLLVPRGDEIRNLQVIVNETIEESSSGVINNNIFEDENH